MTTKSDIMPKPKTKSFQKYIETRFSKEELAAIKAEAEHEVSLLRMRVTCNISPADHKKIKRLAACCGTSMREILTEIIHNGLEKYEDCPKDHIPNAATIKSIENVEAGIGLKSFNSVEELFEELRK